MSRQVIVVVSEEQDSHVRFVRTHLTSELVLIAPAAVISGAALSFEYRNGKGSVIYSGRRLDNVKSVWWRKPWLQTPKLPVPKEYLQYSYLAIRAHTDALKSAFSDAFWLSDYFAIKRASSKPLQQEVAAGLGFVVPATLITSDASAAAAFIAAHDAVVVKPLATAAPDIKRNALLPTTLLDKKRLPTLTGLHLAPSIFQEAIDVDYDLRITVVGSRVFAAKVVPPAAGDPAGVRDIRISHMYGRTHYEQCVLTDGLQAQCIQLVRTLGLMYGAIDMVVDKAGTAWFLEINPNGQWAFIEDETGQSIGKAIADLLEGR